MSPADLISTVLAARDDPEHLFHAWASQLPEDPGPLSLLRAVAHEPLVVGERDNGGGGDRGTGSDLSGQGAQPDQALLLALEGTPLASQIRNRVSALRAACAELGRPLDEVLWAAAACGSRTFSGSLVEDDTLVSGLAVSRNTDDEPGVMVPVLDWLNHSPTARVQFRTETSENRMTFTNPAEHAPGEEVFSNYGTFSNETLLRTYGFALAVNPHGTAMDVQISGPASGAQRGHGSHEVPQQPPAPTLAQALTGALGTSSLSAPGSALVRTTEDGSEFVALTRDNWRSVVQVLEQRLSASVTGASAAECVAAVVVPEGQCPTPWMPRIAALRALLGVLLSTRQDLERTEPTARAQVSPLHPHMVAAVHRYRIDLATLLSDVVPLLRAEMHAIASAGALGFVGTDLFSPLSIVEEAWVAVDPPVPELEPAMSSWRRWVTAAGGAVHPRLGLDAEGRLQFGQTPGGGGEAHSASTHSAATPVLAIPKSLMITRAALDERHPRLSRLLGETEAIDPAVALALLFLQEMRLGDRSPWHCCLAVERTLASCRSVLLWPEEDFALLGSGSAAAARALSVKEQLTEQLALAVSAGMEPCGLDEFLESWCFLEPRKLSASGAAVPLLSVPQQHPLAEAVVGLGDPWGWCLYDLSDPSEFLAAPRPCTCACVDPDVPRLTNEDLLLRQGVALHLNPAQEIEIDFMDSAGDTHTSVIPAWLPSLEAAVPWEEVSLTSACAASIAGDNPDAPAEVIHGASLEAALGTLQAFVESAIQPGFEELGQRYALGSARVPPPPDFCRVQAAMLYKLSLRAPVDAHAYLIQSRQAQFSND